MTNRIRAAVITCAAAFIVAAAVAIPALSNARSSGRLAHPAASRTQTLHVYDTPVALTLTDAHGKAIKHPAAQQPRPGDVLDSYSVEYVGDHSHHAAHWSMSAHVRCLFGKGEPTCQSNVAIGGSLLVFDGNTLAEGTGVYQGATGRILSNKTIGNTGNADIVARITRR